jgi:MFS family permease
MTSTDDKPAPDSTGADGAPGGAGASPARRFARLRGLDRNVRALGVVSFFADVSSETIYPLFPLFVTVVLGAPVAVLGVIEGIAEATASITKWPFGQASDYTGRRRIFVAAGYGASALGKLILALSFVWPVALVARFVDRIGKGVRTAPRDALIAASTPAEQRGLAFGLHRTMDTMGAVIGPLFALLLVELHVSYRTIFAWAIVPGIVSVFVIARFVRERAQAPARPSFRPHLPASPTFRWLLASAVFFGIGNSSDAFILLRANALLRPHFSSAGAAAGVILLYVLYNVTYAGGSLPFGGLSDRIGQVPLVLAGYLVFAAVYAGFATTSSLVALVVLFAVYGLYIAATDGTSKALISRAVPDEGRASAMGLYATVSGVATLIASSVGGVLWSVVGPQATFVYGAACALVAAVVLAIARPRLELR